MASSGLTRQDCNNMGKGTLQQTTIVQLLLLQLIAWGSLFLGHGTFCGSEDHENHGAQVGD